MPELNTVTGADLHWPRGIESASTSDAGKVLTPDSTTAGVGELRLLAESEITGKTAYVVTKFDDISTAGDIYLPVAFAGTVTEVRTVIDGTIATSDCVLTIKKNNVAMTGGTVTIAFSGSAAGDVDSATITALNDVTTTDYINVTSDGASTNTVAATLIFTITRT